MLDAYKLFHKDMYPKNTVLVYSNATARSGKHRGDRNQGYVVVAGTQRLVRKLKDEFQDFFDTKWDTLEPFLKEQLNSFTGIDYSIEHLKELHTLGYLPMVIKGLPEGSKCPYGVPYMTMYNTLPQFYWLTNYLETYMSCEIWNVVTATTTSHQYYQLLSKHAMKTVGNTDFVPIQGHDFAMRGHNGSEAAAMVGLGHLMGGFIGGDTVPAYLDAQYYYDTGVNDWTNFPKGIVSTSVPATEHSVQCAHFNPEDGNELAYLDHILNLFPTGIVSIVCDGYDFWKFLTEVLPQRKEQILARNGKVVIRPDSGDPVDIICGIGSSPRMGVDSFDKLTDLGKGLRKYGDCDISLHEYKGAVEILHDIFGGTTTEKGYKLLDEHIGLIYGDSITLDIADETCNRLEAKGFASINWVAGIGSFTYQHVTRDTDGQAFKATYIELEVPVTGRHFDKTTIIGKEIFKDPKTGDGLKKSAKGLLSVHRDLERAGTPLFLKNQQNWEEEKLGELLLIFKNGELLNQTTLFEIRERLNK